MDLARPLPPELAELSQARQALEASRDLSKVRAIRDMAQAAETYARARKLGEDAERYAAEIVTRATRRIGELLNETPPEHGINQNISPGSVPKLTARQQVGSKNVSAASQQLAAMPEPEFESALTKMKRPSVSRLLRIQLKRS